MLTGSHSADYLEDIVPPDKRESSTKMALLWVTFIASVSNVYTGFLARSLGLTLGKVLIACAVAVAVVTLYGVFAASLGSETGQAHSVLTRGILGQSGSGLASVLLLVTGLGWYGFQAYFLAQLLQGLFNIHHLAIWSGVFGMVMVTNNLLGFRGLAKFARAIAAPLLLIWGLYTIIKAFSTAAGPHLFAAPHVAVTSGILITVETMIGAALYGNEPDIFRYAKRDRTWHVVPMFFGYAMGIFVFPVAGYLMAELSNASTFGGTVHFFLHFSMFGLTFLAVILFVSNQVALNDANLYEGVNAIQNVLRGRYRIATVLGLGVIGAALAVYMNSLQNNFFIVANITAVCLPCTTLVMALDVLLLEKLAHVSRPAGPEGSRRGIVAWADSSKGNVVGIVAILAGLAVGGYTGGLIPGLKGFNHTNIGIPGLQAWATAVAVYIGGLLLMRLVGDRRTRQLLLGIPTSMLEPAAVDVRDTAPVPVALAVEADAAS